MNSVILVQFIIFLYGNSLFIFNHLLSKDLN